MKSFLSSIWQRIKEHWYTSTIGISIFMGYHLLYKGKISFEDFKDYVALIPTILLLLMRDKPKSRRRKPPLE